MARIKSGDRVKTLHPAGHYLLGEVVELLNRSTETKARYALVTFDHGPGERVSIELLELVERPTSKVREVKVKPDIEEHVNELGNYPVQTSSESALNMPSSLTLLMPSVNKSVAFSLLYEGESGSIEAKRIKGNIYYYLRRTGSRGQQESIYLASRWQKAIEVAGRYRTKAIDGLPF